MTNTTDYSGPEIAKAMLIDDISKFVALPENGNDPTSVLKKLDDQHVNYKCLEMMHENNKRKLKAKIPELESSLNVVRKLQRARKEAEAAAAASLTIEQYFPIADHVYMKSAIEVNGGGSSSDSDRTTNRSPMVYLHLGANVIVEYELNEAETILSGHIETAKVNYERTDRTLMFLREQIVTTELNMSRVHNWRVRNGPATAAATGNTAIASH